MGILRQNGNASPFGISTQDHVHPATAPLNAGAHLPLGCPSHREAGKLARSVSGWATNPKSIKSLQPARRGSPAGSGAGARSSLGRSLPLRPRPRPRPGPEAPRPPPARFPPSGHSLSPRPGPRRPQLLGVSSLPTGACAGSAQLPAPSPGPPRDHPVPDTGAKSARYLPSRVRGAGRVVGARLRHRAAARLG